MKSPTHKEQSFRDKLYASVQPNQHAAVDALLVASIRGSERIEGIKRARASYQAESPCKLPRAPRDER